MCAPGAFLWVSVGAACDIVIVVCVIHSFFQLVSQKLILHYFKVSYEKPTVVHIWLCNNETSEKCGIEASDRQY